MKKIENNQKFWSPIVKEGDSLGMSKLNSFSFVNGVPNPVNNVGQ